MCHMLVLEGGGFGTNSTQVWEIRKHSAQATGGLGPLTEWPRRQGMMGGADAEQKVFHDLTYVGKNKLGIGKDVKAERESGFSQPCTRTAT